MDMSFVKMHGLGNDFAIIDQRINEIPLGCEQIRHIANRRRGVGCDQVIFMEPSTKADIFMRIYNPDGSEAGACGNATRCVADILMKETGKETAAIETISGILNCARADKDLISVDMGVPKLDWQDIPLAREMDTVNLDYRPHALLSEPGAVNVGNPHCVFFVDDVEALDIEALGPAIETDTLFPERINVEFVQVLASDKMRMRVWERGAGVTEACGTGACATLVAAVRKGFAGRKASIVLDGGALVIEWRESDGHIIKTGPASFVFEGCLKNMI